MIYDTFDILSRMGVDIKNKTGNIRGDCPFCGVKHAFSIYRGGAKHGHWHCFHCENSGGAMKLFVLMKESNLNPDNEGDRKEIHEQILEYLNLDTHEKWMPKAVPPLPKNEVCLPVEKRDAVYRFVLSLCALSKKHNENLMDRGFTDETIKGNLYKSVPKNSILIVKQLLAKGYQLKGVPGFYQKDGQWEMLKMPNGIYIPVLNENGLIESLNIRLDKEDNGKYLFLSSADRENGTKVTSTVHFRGDITKVKSLLVIEGLLKTDIAYQELRMPVAGILGSGSISPLLEFIKKHRIKEVKIALDMDQITNQYVQRNLLKLRASLEELKVYYSILTWDVHYKGIDDYLTRAL